MSGKLSLPSGQVFSQQAERRGLARLAAGATNLSGPKLRKNDTNKNSDTWGSLRCVFCVTEQAQRRPPDWVAYTDGSEDLGKAGWAYTVLIGGDAIGDEGASLASEGYGPVVTSAAHPAYLGARKHTNNTAELTALSELLRALLSSSPQRAGSRGVVRTDSE